MEERSLSQADAQRRVDQIHAFQQEMTTLENEGVLTISTEQTNKVQGYHARLLQTLSANYDVDTNAKSKQLTLGMKIASLFGALAMAASIFFLFYQFWGYLNTPVQVTILVLAPVLLFVLSFYLAQKQHSAYFSKIAALVSLSCFVLNLSMLGQVFNITPSPNAFAVWAAFGFLLAYACNARLLLFFAIACISSFIAMKIGTWSGIYWISFGEKPEHFFIPGLIIFLLPQFINHKRFTGFDVIYRVTAMIMLFLPILILANWGKISYLSWPTHMIEGAYQVIGFALSASAIWLGIKRHWNEVVNTGNVFFVLFLYTKLFDWWWEWMPKYIFFFLLGLSALLALTIFKRIRQSNVSEGVAQ
ncbi:DUF2157 domain-containing protein [Flocculibacter collagenilyticus]|uniref:DUF2157 domain-containing protein n=1 Tax=Flocculibacter collagenilyticus TaxID=2744479 RepID=UPI0018F35AA8|nr:DUF2157 domain-containing protein [Flocculibacter collagenilyticus]